MCVCVYVCRLPFTSWGWGGHNIVANTLDCDIIVSKFKTQSCFYVHF